MQELVIAVAASLVVSVVVFAVRGLRLRRERKAVCDWLLRNTRDEPGESHVPTVAIAKGAGLPEERARLACLTDERIHRGPGEPESWSIWRSVPQSIYEKRDVLIVDA
mgnify:CR=1 FL=1